ncbi:MAG: orotidine-5'-phosphate decarboxylase [Thermoanaerobaculales bacterium]|jgi:orotidine-5'-phosphate decarboxylase|nr:orotidine-5'-phosphate decarboxylase [Thermoanaerobaculales bacterium]
MADHRDKLCVALDGSDRDWIVATSRVLGGQVGWLKLGLEAFTAFGPPLVEELSAAGRVFLDLKLHDIPNTVRRAAANCAGSGAAMFNIHASGGRAMLAAAVEGAREGAAGKPPLVIAVTVLTSLDEAALCELGLASDPETLVLRWARMARDVGLDGVVASAREAAAIRSECGRDFLIVTPGIRPSWSAAGDQKRVMTPARALAAGADVLVVGRPITGAADPRAAARRVLSELAG